MPGSQDFPHNFEEVVGPPQGMTSYVQAAKDALSEVTPGAASELDTIGLISLALTAGGFDHRNGEGIVEKALNYHSNQG